MPGRSFHNLVDLMKHLGYCEVLILTGEKGKLLTLKECLVTLLR